MSENANLLAGLPDTPDPPSDPSDPRINAPAVIRNQEPIAAILAPFLPAQGLVLEVGSGSGEHICYFAERFAHLMWQPSDNAAERLQSIEAWRRRRPRPNLRSAITLDVLAAPWPIAAADAVIAINLLHVTPWTVALALLDGASRILPPDGVLYIYGPFLRDGEHTSAGNAEFDRLLRERDAALGLRHAEAVAAAAAQRGFAPAGLFPMPANNLSLVFRRR